MSQTLQTPMNILIVEPDDQTRPALKYNLQRWGYRVVVSLDKADAIERVKYGEIRPEIILLNQIGQSIEQLAHIGQSILQIGELSENTCIVIMAEQYGPDLEGQDIQVNKQVYVTYLEDGQQLKNLLHHLCPTEISRDR